MGRVAHVTIYFMPPKSNDNQIQEWVNTGFKSLAFCVFTMFTFFVNQLNNNIDGLTKTLKSMEDHQVESDKRIAEIETSRKISMVGYDKLVSDVGEMKASMIQNTMRLQTISDFVAKHIK